jgi:uncharacterized membrane protein
MSKDDDWWKKELGLDEESNKTSKKQKKIKVKDIANAGMDASQLKLWGFLFVVLFLIFIVYQSFGSKYAQCVNKGKKDGTFRIEVIKGICAAKYK